MKNRILISLFILVSMIHAAAQEQPLRLAIAGVTHDHIHEVAVRLNSGDFELVGVYEQNDNYRNSNALTGKVDASLFYADLEDMLDTVKPEAVAAYVLYLSILQSSKHVLRAA